MLTGDCVAKVFGKNGFACAYIARKYKQGRSVRVVIQSGKTSPVFSLAPDFQTAGVDKDASFFLQPLLYGIESDQEPVSTPGV